MVKTKRLKLLVQGKHRTLVKKFPLTDRSYDRTENFRGKYYLVSN